MSSTGDNVFSSTTQMKIGKHIYIIERHFTGGRSLVEAVHAVVKSEATRLDTAHQDVAGKSA